MPRFKVKDLMIDVLPVEKAELGDLEICWISDPCRLYHSCLKIISRCDRYHTFCPWNSQDPCRFLLTDWCVHIQTLRVLACHAGTKLELDPGEWVINPHELDVLHEQLKIAMNRVEIAQERVAREGTPRTVEEIEALEDKLTEALGELAALKKDMKKD